MELTKSLIQRQDAFESFVREKLFDMSAAIDELLFLASLSQSLPGGGDSWSYETSPCTPGEHSVKPLTPGERSSLSLMPCKPGEGSHQSVTPFTPVDCNTPSMIPHTPSEPKNKPSIFPTVEHTPDINLSNLKAAAIRSKSCSRKNYATNLAREVFTVDERSTHNVSGACGKPQLDPDKIEFIKRLSFEHFPLSNSENSHKAWQDCVKAIDSASRSLARKLKENIPEQT